MFQPTRPDWQEGAAAARGRVEARAVNPSPRVLPAPGSSAEAPVSAFEPDEHDMPRLTRKWGGALSAGYQVLPDVIVRHQRALGLSATDLVVILNLNAAWWRRERPPFPRIGTIARRMDITERTVQRSLAKLEKLGLIQRRRENVGQHGKSRQVFDLTPLAAHAESFAQLEGRIRPSQRTQDGGTGVQTPVLADAGRGTA